MGQGFEWLSKIAERMKEASASGTAYERETLTVREFLGQFGAQRRGTRINNRINNELMQLGLCIDRDLASGWIDASLTIELDDHAPSSSHNKHIPDPTHRISALEAANKPPKSVHPDDPLEKATTIMHCHDYSQLPVMTNERDVKGIVSWKLIGKRLSMGWTGKSVSKYMEPAQELPDTTPLLQAIATIEEHEYVLVRNQEKKIAGIVTAYDLSRQFLNLTGPFLLVGEIEGYLRHFIHGKFNPDELKSPVADERRREIEGPANLTLGEYCRLLEKPENWEKLGLNIDRREFIKHLDRIREIRNDVMHFTPDGIAEEELNTLQYMVIFFRFLSKQG